MRGACGGDSGWEGRGTRAWQLAVLGLVLGFVLASRALELKPVGRQRRPSPEGCQLGQSAPQPGGARGDARGAQLWPHSSTAEGVPRNRNFLFVGVLIAQKYLQTRAVAAYRMVQDNSWES